MPILFLDFDGVLHEMKRSRGELCLRPHFEDVMRDLPHVDIVISSAWRKKYSVDELRALFSPDIAARILGVTPDLVGDGVEQPSEHVRESEVKAWLRDHGREQEHWVALDDCLWNFEEDCPNLVEVDETIGFDYTIEAELKRRLPANPAPQVDA